MTEKRLDGRSICGFFKKNSNTNKPMMKWLVGKFCSNQWLTPKNTSEIIQNCVKSTQLNESNWVSDIFFLLLEQDFLAINPYCTEETV